MISQFHRDASEPHLALAGLFAQARAAQQSSRAAETSYDPKKVRAKEHYLPQYKWEDKIRALLFEHGIVDCHGKVHPSLAFLSPIPLEAEELTRLKSALGHSFTVSNHAFNFGFQVSAQSIIQELLANAQGSSENPTPHFKDFDVVGSTAMQILGVAFLKRFVFRLLKTAMPAKDESAIQEILGQIFTPECIKLLESKINQKTADMDIRAIVQNGAAKTAGSATIHQVQDALIKLALKKMPPMDRTKREQALEKLKSVVPHADFEWLQVDDPMFDYHIIKYLAFAKLATVSKDGNCFGLASLGDPSGYVLDFVIVLDLLRDEMFPSVKIPCGSLFDPSLKDAAIVPAGENWVQALVDKMCGVVRPDISLATEDDLKMLLCRYTKGETAPADGVEESLFKIARKECLNSKNKTVKKCLSTRFELRHNLRALFPYFLLQLLKDTVQTHLDKDPLAAIALTANAVRLFQNKLTDEQLAIIIEGMQTYWLQLNGGKPNDHLLFTIGKLLAEDYNGCVSLNSLTRRMPLLKLCAYLHCQAKLPDASDSLPVAVHPRSNETRPCFELRLQGPQKSYSLLLDAANPHLILKDALRYLNIAKPADSRKAVEQLMMALAPKNSFGGAGSSPLLHDLPFFNVNLEQFEQTALSCLANVHPCLGAVLIFGAQAQQARPIPLNELLINLPSMILKAPQRSSYLFDNLEVLLQNGEEKSIFTEFRVYTAENVKQPANQLYVKWLELLCKNKSWTSLAYQFLNEQILSSTAYSIPEKTSILAKFFEQARPNDPSCALKSLVYLNQKALLPLKTQIRLLDDLIQTYTASGQTAYLQDIYRIEKLAQHMADAVSSDKMDDCEEPLKAALGKIPEGLQSPKLRLCIQNPIIVRLPKVEEEPAKAPDWEAKAASIESLIDSDHEEAAEQLIALSKHIFSIPPSKAKELLQKIIDKCLQKDTLPIAHSLLKNRYLQDFFQVNEEPYFICALDGIAYCDSHHSQENEQIRISLLESVLKAFANNQKPNLTFETLIRLANELNAVIHNPYYLSRPIPESFLKAFKNAFPTLFTALQVKGRHLECSRLYHEAFLLDVNSPLLAEFSDLAQDAMLALTNGPITQEVSGLAENMVRIHTSNLKAGNAVKRAKLLRRLLPHFNSADKMVEYLRILESFHAISSAEDLDCLLEAFSKLSEAGEPQSALEILHYFTGRLPSSQFDKRATAYHKFISALYKEENWETVCEALAVDPFEWERPEFAGKLKEYSIRAISRIIQGQSMVSPDQLKMIFSLIERYEIDDLELLLECFGKCPESCDPELAAQLWNVLKTQYSRHDNKQDLTDPQRLAHEKMGMTALAALKQRAPKTIAEILTGDSTLLNICKLASTKEHALDIYQSLWKCWMHVMKSKKGPEKHGLLPALETNLHQVKQSLNSHAGTELALQHHLNLLEFHLGLNDLNLLPQSISHFASLSRAGGTGPALKDRHVKNLNALLTQASKAPLLPCPCNDLIAISQEAFKHNLPVLKRAKLLPHFASNSSPESILECLSIMEATLALSAIPPQELRSLHQYKFAPCLAMIAGQLKDTALFDKCLALLSHPRICLYVNAEERGSLMAQLADFTLKQARAEDAKLRAESAERGIDFVIKKIQILKNAKGEVLEKCLRDSAVVLLELLEQGHTDQFKGLSGKIPQTPGSEALLLSALQAARLKIGAEHDKKAEGLIEQLNLALRNVITAKQGYADAEISTITEWVLSLRLLPGNPYAKESLELVDLLNHSLSLLQKYPKQVCQLQLLRAILTREGTIVMPANISLHIPDAIHSLFTSLEDVKHDKCPEELHADLKHLFHVCYPLIDDKVHTLIIALMNMIFLKIEYVKSPEKQEQLLKEDMEMWINYVDKHIDKIFQLFPIYINQVESQAFLCKCLEARLRGMMTYLDTRALAKSQKSQIIQHLQMNLYNMYDSLIKDIANSKPEVIQDERALELLKAIPALYLNFMSESKVHFTFEDTFNGFDFYLRMLKSLVEDLNNKVIIANPKHFESLFANMEDLRLNLIGCPSDLKKKIEACKHICAKLRSEFNKKFKTRVKK